MQASTSETIERPTAYQRVAGPGIDLPLEEVMANVARFADLPCDPNAFVDQANPGRRLKIRWPISAGHRAGPAGIAAPHSFHMSFVETRVGNSPAVHTHEYREIFMPVRGNYRIFINRDSGQFVDLGPLDTFSVPPMLWRRLEQLGDPGETGLLMVLYDNVDDPNTGIFVPQEVIDADRARGIDPYAKAGG